MKDQHECVRCHGHYSNLTRHLVEKEGIRYSEVQNYVPYKLRPRKGTKDESGQPVRREGSRSPVRTPNKPVTIPAPAASTPTTSRGRGRGRRGGSAERSFSLNEDEVVTHDDEEEEVNAGEDVGETPPDMVEDDGVKTGN